jgi:hypothetical protein
MPKVFGLHEVELPPGVTPEEHEQHFGQELASLPDYQGWKTYLLKGDRGASWDQASQLDRLSRGWRPVKLT